MSRALVALLMLLGGVAHADERAFQDASRRAAAGDPGAIDAFEAAGAARPVSRWSDDAWAEAARLAERARDFDRARRDLEHAIALATEPLVLRRLRADLARLGKLTGDGGWNAVAAEHDRLINAAAGGGDPTGELEDLERLVRAPRLSARTCRAMGDRARLGSGGRTGARARSCARRCAPRRRPNVARTASRGSGC
ncbi:MAG: hypothetical protein WKG01_17495 [Kofleriaceae bacterium]